VETATITATSTKATTRKRFSGLLLVPKEILGSHVGVHIRVDIQGADGVDVILIPTGIATHIAVTTRRFQVDLPCKFVYQGKLDPGWRSGIYQFDESMQH